MPTPPEKLALAIGTRIRRIREIQNLTQEKLAYESEGLGSKGYLSDIEAGKRLPSLRALAGLADRLGVEVFELLLDEEGPRAHQVALAALRSEPSEQSGR